MFTVSEPNLSITFKNCIIDVKGLFFRSTLPVTLVFDNCQFKVVNTTTLVHLDFSANQQNGCTGTNINAGDLTITNSFFIDSTYNGISNTASEKYLFKLSSLYDVTFTNVQFNGLKQKHMIVLGDHLCQSTPSKA